MSQSNENKRMKAMCKDHPNAPVLRDFIPNAVVCALCGVCVGNSDDLQEDDKHIKSCRAESRHEKILTTNFREISVMGQRINVPPNIERRAMFIFKEIISYTILKRYSYTAKGLVSLYVACRQECVPRTVKEICAVGGVTRREIHNCLKAVTRTLNVKLDSLTFSDFMARFSSKLSLTKEIERSAIEIVQKANEEHLLSGRSPVSVAATAIYIAAKALKQKRSQKMIHDVTGVADSTVRRIYNILRPQVKHLFPPKAKSRRKSRAYLKGVQSEPVEISDDPDQDPVDFNNNINPACISEGSLSSDSEEDEVYID